MLSMLTGLNNSHMRRLLCQQGTNELCLPALRYLFQYAHCCCNCNCCRRSVAYFSYTSLSTAKPFKLIIVGTILTLTPIVDT